MVSLHVLACQVNVDLRRFDPVVSKNRLQLTHASTGADVIGSESMAEGMRPAFGPVIPALPEQAPVDLQHALSGVDSGKGQNRTLRPLSAL